MRLLLSEANRLLCIPTHRLQIFQNVVDRGLVLDKLGRSVIQKAHLAFYLISHHLLNSFEERLVDKRDNIVLFCERDLLR